MTWSLFLFSKVAWSELKICFRCNPHRPDSWPDTPPVSLGSGACGHAGVIIWISAGITAGHLSLQSILNAAALTEDKVETEMVKLRHQLKTGDYWQQLHMRPKL